MRTQHEKYLIQHGWSELPYTVARWRDPVNGQVLKTNEAVEEQRKRVEYEAQQIVAPDCSGAARGDNTRKGR